MPTKGLGDVVKSLTEKLGIKQCDKCKKRQQLLNRWVNFYPKMNSEQISIFERLMDEEKPSLAAIIRLYEDVYKKRVNCTTCSAPKIIEQLTISYEISG